MNDVQRDLRARPTTSRPHAARLAALVLCAGATLPAASQQGASPGPGSAFDVNAVRAGQPGAERLVGTATSRLGDATGQLAEEGPTYRISRFLIEYRTEHPQHPSAEDVLASPVRLGVDGERYVSPASGASTTLRLRDITASNPGLFSAGALSSIARAMVGTIQDMGLASIVVQLHPDDVNAQTGEDLRPTKDGDLRLIVWTGVVGDVRTVAAGDRLEARIAEGRLDRVNSADPVHRRIREQSPVREGELVSKGAIDDFVFRLNRHPGRRVDVAVSPGEEEGSVALDYIVQEQRPWSVYAQLSNTGTEATSEWRQRLGFVHNQLTGSDDMLRLDFVTNGLDQSNAVLGSYDFPLRSDTLRLRIGGAFSEYDASEVGLSDESFSGQNYSVNADLAWTFFQRRQWFIDATFGVRFQSSKVTNDLFNETGSEQYFVPSLGLRTERVTGVSETFAGISMEFQQGDLSGVNFEDLQRLGRTPVDEDWQVLKFDASHSFYIEPLISELYKGTGEGGPTTLAHELAFWARGQYAFNNRLVPIEQDVAGGFFSVRGYPESIVAGDSAVLVSAEYRFHWPRTWAISQPGTINGQRVGWADRMVGEDRTNRFRFAPEEAFGRTDWDLIFRGFVDAASTDVSFAQAGEDSYTLVGAGIGAELQWKSHLTLRLDWGMALSEVDQPGNPVDSGDNRLHFLLTGKY